MGLYDKIGVFPVSLCIRRDCMRQPQTIWSLCAFIFGLMGIIFVFLGMLFYITDIPVNGGCNWFFIPIGAILLLGSIVCLARCGLQEQRRKHLKTNGISVVGKIQSVRHLVWINWNTKTFVNWPGQCSPWVVQCSYCYGGRTYTVKSLLSWIKPAADFQQPLFILIHAIQYMPMWIWIQSSGNFHLFERNHKPIISTGLSVDFTK